jgi:hypothetical protein
MKTTTKKVGTGVSPYTPQNVDIAIRHLDRPFAGLSYVFIKNR